MKFLGLIEVLSLFGFLHHVLHLKQLLHIDLFKVQLSEIASVNSRVVVTSVSGALFRLGFVLGGFLRGVLLIQSRLT